MGFVIEFSSNAGNFMRRLPSGVSLRIIEKFRQLGENPFRFLKHYEGDYYKFRVGDYRALIDIDFKNKILFVEVLDKRGRVYK